MINDRDINLRLGTAYLKLLLDDFGGSQATGHGRPTTPAPTGHGAGARAR
jgi:soluble lytic murein transglycosylase-like protein